MKLNGHESCHMILKYFKLDLEFDHFPSKLILCQWLKYKAIKDSRDIVKLLFDAAHFQGFKDVCL